MRPQRLILAWIVLAGTALGAAEEADSPRATMTRLYRAIEAGDSAAVRAAFHAADEKERNLVDAFVRQMVSAQAMADVLKQRFGAGMPGEGLSKGMPARESIARLEKAVQEVQGDKATLTIPGQARPLHFVRAGGRWGVSVSDFAGASPQNIAAQTAVLNDMAAAYDAVVADVKADKFVTIADAQRELGQKLQAVMLNALKKNPPQTQPAPTRPADRN